MSLSKSANKYVLNVGKSGKGNLDLQHAMLYEATSGQIEQAGVREGMTVWDIGCGSGNVVEMMSERVGDRGKVYAADVSQQQIEVTSKRLGEKSIQNVEYIVSSIDDLDASQYAKADCVHSRLLLMHLSDVDNALYVMCSLLKPNGIVLSQESSLDSLKNEYENKAINHYYEMAIKYGEKYSLNFNVGSRLETLFRNSNLFSDIEVKRTKFPLDTAQGKALIFSRYDEMKQKLIDAELTDDAEMEEIKRDMMEYDEADSVDSSKIYTEQTSVIARLK